MTSGFDFWTRFEHNQTAIVLRLKRCMVDSEQGVKANEPKSFCLTVLAIILHPVRCTWQRPPLDLFSISKTSAFSFFFRCAPWWLQDSRLSCWVVSFGICDENAVVRGVSDFSCVAWNGLTSRVTWSPLTFEKASSCPARSSSEHVWGYFFLFCWRLHNKHSSMSAHIRNRFIPFLTPLP